MDIGIVIGSVSHVQIAIGDNRGTACSCYMEDVHRETDIERLIQSTDPLSSPIQDLNVELFKMYDMNNVKLTLNFTCLYIKLTTVLFLFELEQCVEHVFYELSQYISCTTSAVFFPKFEALL